MQCGITHKLMLNVVKCHVASKGILMWSRPNGTGAVFFAVIKVMVHWAGQLSGLDRKWQWPAFSVKEEHMDTCFKSYIHYNTIFSSKLGCL